MHKRTQLAAVLVVALSLGMTAVVLGATRSAKQTVLGDIAPVKLPKQTRKPATIRIRTQISDAADPATCNSQTHQCTGTTPPVSDHTYIDFDDDISFNGNVVPNCSLAAISSQDTAGARAACASSMVGKGSALVMLGGIPGQAPPADSALPVVISAFDGQPKNGHPTLYLHAKASGAPAVVLIGELVNSPQPGDYGKRLDVVTPPTGGPVTFFDTFTGGKVLNPTGAATVVKSAYVKARCHDRNRLLNFHALFHYDQSMAPGVYPEHGEAFDTDRCKVKRRRHR